MPVPPKPEIIERAIRKDFACERCGNCCKGFGFVLLRPEDAQRLADRFAITADEFRDRFAELQPSGDHWLRMDWRAVGADKLERSCVFLERDPDGKYRCGVNEDKPEQCSQYPAKWINSDTLMTCSGMQSLFRKLEEDRKSAAEAEKNSEEAA